MPRLFELYLAWLDGVVGWWWLLAMKDDSSPPWNCDSPCQMMVGRLLTFQEGPMIVFERVTTNINRPTIWDSILAEDTKIRSPLQPFNLSKMLHYYGCFEDYLLVGQKVVHNYLLNSTYPLIHMKHPDYLSKELWFFVGFTPQRHSVAGKLAYSPIVYMHPQQSICSMYDMTWFVYYFY